MGSLTVLAARLPVLCLCLTLTLSCTQCSVGAAPGGSLAVLPALPPVLCLTLTRSRNLSRLPTSTLQLPPRMRTFSRTILRSSSPPPAPLLPPGVVLLLGLLGPSLEGGVLS